MEVIAVTLFFSLLLASLFAVLFFLGKSGRKSPEQQALMPLQDDDPAS